MWQDLMLRPINLWSLNMATRNDITGDALISKTLSKEGEANFDKIFGVKKKERYVPPPLPTVEEEPADTEWD